MSMRRFTSTCGKSLASVAGANAAAGVTAVTGGGCSLRYFAKPSATLGPITVEGSFVTKDLTVGQNYNAGGLYARSLFAIGDMGFGRELMNIPCRFMYIGDEPLREQCVILARELFSQLVSKGPKLKFIEQRVLTMMPGGKGFFFRERDAEAFAETVPMGLEYLSRQDYTLYDLQKLPMIVWFNRWDVEYNGRAGICLFPEVSYFQHSCEPNCEVEILRDIHGEYKAVVRARKPIKKGEELSINYMPGNRLPITRLHRIMRARWQFECMCSQCKSRYVNVMLVIAMCLMLPLTYLMRRTFAKSKQNRQMQMGATGKV